MKFRKFQQNKLWRDKAVELMENMGSKIHWKQLNDQEFTEQLKIKLTEETQEVCNAQNKQELMEELADILEVVTAFCDVNNITLQDVITTQNKKRQERGGFSERKFITIAEHPKNSFGEKYCLNDPKKYPEVF